MSLATMDWRCLRTKQVRPGGSRRTVPARRGIPRGPAAIWKVLIVFVLCGAVFFPLDLFAQTQSSAETSSGTEVLDAVQARGEGGYVDMESDGAGDRFVDEDGDGIDDRRMRRHQKRHRQRWNDDQQRGSLSGDGGQATGGSKGYGAGPGPGGAGR